MSTGSTILGIAGTILGGIFGGPAGAAIGGSAGGAVGGLMDPEEEQKKEQKYPWNSDPIRAKAPPIAPQPMQIESRGPKAPFKFSQNKNDLDELMRMIAGGK